MKGKTILIVDDQPPIIRILSEYFTSTGFHVLKSDSCATAIEVLRHEHPDCIILDYTLEDGDARKVCAAIHCDGETTPPVVIFSGSEEARVCLKGRYAADSYVSKCTPLNELLIVVDNLIAERNIRRGK